MSRAKSHETEIRVILFGGDLHRSEKRPGLRRAKNQFPPMPG
jgi:hypothetical protein